MSLSDLAYIDFLFDQFAYSDGSNDPYFAYVNDDLIYDDGCCSHTLQDSHLYY